MPYMYIHRTKDGKWHRRDCSLLNPDTDANEDQAIGSTATKPEPPKTDMCEKCWSFLFPKNAPADLPAAGNVRRDVAFSYVDVTTKGCEGWLNLFWGDHCVALVDNAVIADQMRKVIAHKPNIETNRKGKD